MYIDIISTKQYKKTKKNKKIKKIKFLDFWQNNKCYYVYLLTEILKNEYIITDNNPDIIIFSLFGSEHLDSKYKQYKKILVNHENRIDMMKRSNYDIALSFKLFNDKKILNNYYSWMIQMDGFLDKSLFNKLNKLYPRDKYIYKHSKECTRKKFCCFLVSNPNCEFRNKFFKYLSLYKNVDSGGKHLNNIGKIINPYETKKWCSEYKFMICFENSSSKNYLTEKLIQAYTFQTIPIYWGDPNVEKIINPECFINCHNYNNIFEVIDEIVKIDRDDTIYKKMTKQPLFKDINFIKKYNMNHYVSKLNHFLKN